MYCRRAVIVALCLLCSNHVLGERYIVTDDVFGNAAAKAFSESESEKQALESSSSQEGIAADVERSNVVDETDQTASGFEPPSPSNQSSADEQQSLSASDEPLDEVNPVSSKEEQPPVKENPFERELRLSQGSETDEVIRRLRAQGGDNSFDATQINPADFVDSEDLLQGNVNSDGERPFFVTIDSQGESDVIFYSPKVIEQEINRRQREEQVSTAVVFTPNDKNAKLTLPKDADPVAANILSSGAGLGYFEQFQQQCCRGLPNVGVRTLRKDKALHVPLLREDFSYRFVDGDSRYQLVKLPDLGRNYKVTVKSFVRAYKDKGIKHGAFIPQLVMLDRDKNVKRIISELDSESHAETWSSYGYLKSVIEVKQQQVDAEALVLVYTRARDLRQVTTVEDSSGAWEIKHMEVGSLQFEIAASDKP